LKDLTQKVHLCCAGPFRSRSLGQGQLHRSKKGMSVYHVHRWLPSIESRKAVLFTFYQTCNLPDPGAAT